VECYTKGSCFVREGEIPFKIGFLVQGLVKYYYIDADGNEWIKHFSAEKEFVASYASFLYQTPSLYFIEAIEETTLLSINYDVYINFLQNSFTCERYHNFFNGHKNIANRLTLKDIASYLGMTAVQLSRIRNKKTR
jgi:CRP-like cAMP-binding protein